MSSVPGASPLLRNRLAFDDAVSEIGVRAGAAQPDAPRAFGKITDRQQVKLTVAILPASTTVAFSLGLG